MKVVVGLVSILLALLRPKSIDFPPEPICLVNNHIITPPSNIIGTYSINIVKIDDASGSFTTSSLNVLLSSAFSITDNTSSDFGKYNLKLSYSS